ncbi:hypothetical protein EON82_18565, partial [bacterium]
MRIIHNVGMRFEHEPGSWIEVVDARPARDGWAVLTRDGSLLGTRVDLEGLQGTLELHLSPDEQFAAVVERFGQFGRVFELSTGHKTMDLDRGDYHPETSVHPAAFFTLDGRTLLVHGTDWNRLDVSDPETGEVMTTREPTSCVDAGDVPEHYLDYFHAGLSVSP